MRIDKSTKFFLFFALIVFSILLLNSCTDYDSTITAGNNPISSTYYIKAEESSFPLNVALKEGESIYLEACDINIELYTIYFNYPTTRNNQAIIKISYDYFSTVSEFVYNSSEGMDSYYAENRTNYVFHFNRIVIDNNHFELDLTINRYYKL